LADPGLLGVPCLVSIDWPGKKRPLASLTGFRTPG
jgi:hypothetical protein